MLVPLAYLTIVGQIALTSATIAYCGSKLCWKPALLYHAAAQLSTFASVAVLTVLFLTWAEGHFAFVRSSFKRITKPVRDRVTDILWW